VRSYLAELTVFLIKLWLTTGLNLLYDNRTAKIGDKDYRTGKK